jgi:hypothetical protein
MRWYEPSGQRIHLLANKPSFRAFSTLLTAGAGDRAPLRLLRVVFSFFTSEGYSDDYRDIPAFHDPAAPCFQVPSGIFHLNASIVSKPYDARHSFILWKSAFA